MEKKRIIELLTELRHGLDKPEHIQAIDAAIVDVKRYHRTARQMRNLGRKGGLATLKKLGRDRLATIGRTMGGKPR